MKISITLFKDGPRVKLPRQSSYTSNLILFSLSEDIKDVIFYFIFLTRIGDDCTMATQ